jgi:hypothetical protein
MSIKPIDFQVMYPKTSEVSKIQNEEANKNQANIQQQASTNQNRIDDKLKQVVARENIQNGRVDEKQQKDTADQNQKKKQQPKRRGTPKIDITI